MTNRNYGKLNDGVIAYAPIELTIDGAIKINPSAADYAACGWLPIRDEKPSGKVGVYYIPDGWEIRPDEQTSASAIYRTYREEPIVAPPPPVTRYSGWKMYKAIKAEGYGEAFDELMKNNIGVMIAFVRPQYFLSDDKDFTTMVTQMCSALHIDDETKERILAASVDEEVAT